MTTCSTAAHGATMLHTEMAMQTELPDAVIAVTSSLVQLAGPCARAL